MAARWCVRTSCWFAWCSDPRRLRSRLHSPMKGRQWTRRGLALRRPSLRVAIRTATGYRLSVKRRGAVFHQDRMR
eukprot:2554638-Pleurochrysis_carterae.AAC.1